MNFSYKEIIAAGVLTAAGGAAAGTWVEVEQVNDAKAELVTVGTCLETNPVDTPSTQNTIDAALAKCLTDGVPGGKGIGNDGQNAKIVTGAPIQYVYSLREGLQQDEQFEVTTVLEWAAAAPLVIGGAAVFWYYCCD